MKRKLMFIALLMFIVATLCGCGASITIGGIDNVTNKALSNSFDADKNVLDNLKKCVGGIKEFETPIAAAITRTNNAKNGVSGFSITNLIYKATVDAKDDNGNPIELSTFEKDLINSLEIEPMEKVLPQVCGGLFCGLETVAVEQKNFENFFYTDNSTFFQSKDTNSAAGATPFYAALNTYVGKQNATTKSWEEVKKLFCESNGSYKKGVDYNGKWKVSIPFESGNTFSAFDSSASVTVLSDDDLMNSTTFYNGYMTKGDAIMGVKIPKFNDTARCDGTSNAGNKEANTKQIVKAACRSAELCGVTEYTFTRDDSHGTGSFTVEADITDDSYKVGTAKCNEALSTFRTNKKTNFPACPGMNDKAFAQNVCNAIDTIKKSTSKTIGDYTVTYAYSTNNEKRQTKVKLIEVDGLKDASAIINDENGGKAFSEFTFRISYKGKGDWQQLFTVKVTVSVEEREFKPIYGGDGKGIDVYNGIQGILQMKRNLSAFGKSTISFLSYDYSSSMPKNSASDTTRSDLIDAINKCNSGNVYVLKARKDSWDASKGSMMSTLNAFMKKTPAEKEASYTTYFTGTFGTNKNRVHIDMIDEKLAEKFILPVNSTATKRDKKCAVDLNVKGENESAGLFGISVGLLYKETFNQDFLKQTTGYTGYGFLFDVIIPTGTGSTDQILLLKKYPVDVVSKIKTTESSRKYTLTTKDSGMLYDIASGDLFINQLANASITMTDADAMNNDYNLLSQGKVYDIESIALAPTGDMEVNNTSVNVKADMTMPSGITDRMTVLDKSGNEVAGGTFGFKSHLLLRDYAEGMYAPGIYPDEDIVALGLKLRLDTDWVCAGTPYTWDNVSHAVAEEIPFVESSQTFHKVYITDLMGYTDNKASVTSTGVGDTPYVKNDAELTITGVTLGSKTKTNEDKDAVMNQSTTWDMSSTAGGTGLSNISVSINASDAQKTSSIYAIQNASSVRVQLKGIPAEYQANGADLIEDASNTRKVVVYSIDVGGKSVTPYTGGVKGGISLLNSQVTGYSYNSATHTADFAATFALPARSTTGDTVDVTVKFTPQQSNSVELVVKFKVTYEYNSTTQTAGNAEILKLRSSRHEAEGVDTTVAAGHAGVPAYYQLSIPTGLLKTNTTPPSNWTADCARHETPNSDKTPYMWIMGCDLMSDDFLTKWIAPDINTGVQSLSTWCNWTASIGLVNYPVDANTTIDDILTQIDDMLHDVYNFAEIISDDTITFDERVVEIITEQIKREQTKEQYRWITTVCKIIGILLTIYALALIVAWILDVGSNAEGDGLLYKLSFKKLRAAVDKETVGSLNNEHSGTKYIAIGSLAIRAAILIAFGLVLVFVNPIDLVFDIIALVERFTAWISDSVFNE